MKIGIIIIGDKHPYVVEHVLNKLQDYFEFEYISINWEHEKKNIPQRVIRYAKTRGFLPMLSRAFFSLICSIELKLLNKYYRNFLERYDINNKIPNISISVNISNKNVWSLDDENQDILISRNYDLLLRADGGILSGDFIESARLGILSAHHGDHMHYRGSAACFYETLYAERSIGWCWQLLGNKLDDGKILLNGDFATGLLLTKNLARAHAKSASSLCFLLRNMAADGNVIEGDRSMQNRPPCIYTNTYSKTPFMADQFLYVIKTIYRIIKNKVLGLLGYQRLWRIGVVQKHFDLNQAILSKKFHDRFHADPFVTSIKGETFVFCEEYLIDENKGRIAVFKLENSALKNIGTAIEEKYHVSFPQLLTFDDQSFQIVESGSVGFAYLYRAIDFPLKWEKHCKLLELDGYTDLMFYKIQGKIFLFGSFDYSPLDERNFCGFYCDVTEFISGHRTAPYTVDDVTIYSHTASNNRSAGCVLRKDEFVYRCYQTNGFCKYGGSTGLQAIRTEDDGLVFENQHNEVAWRDGIHTLNIIDELVVFDFAELRRL